jgi:hypothetical protein
MSQQTDEVKAAMDAFEAELETLPPAELVIQFENFTVLLACCEACKGDHERQMRARRVIIRKLSRQNPGQ